MPKLQNKEFLQVGFVYSLHAPLESITAVLASNYPFQYCIILAICLLLVPLQAPQDSVRVEQWDDEDGRQCVEQREDEHDLSLFVKVKRTLDRERIRHCSS